jgi:hypothetical protein
LVIVIARQIDLVEWSATMIPDRLFLIAPLALVPALIACHQAPVPAPLAPAALAAVVADPGDTPREGLAQRIDALFTAPDAGETRALLVWHDGRLIAERYGPGYDRNTRFISWSMAKSVTGVLIGMLVSDGRLRLDDPAPIPLWQRPGDPRGEITLRQLLQMRSGLRHVEAGDPPYRSDEVRMLFLDGRDDMARYAEAQPLHLDEQYRLDPGQWLQRVRCRGQLLPAFPCRRAEHDDAAAADGRRSPDHAPAIRRGGLFHVGGAIPRHVGIARAHNDGASGQTQPVSSG